MTRSFLAWILRWQSLTDIKIDIFLITISNWHFYMLILHKDGNEKMMSIWNYTSLFQKMYTFTHFCNFCLKILWFVLNTYNRIIVYGKEKAKKAIIWCICFTTWSPQNHIHHHTNLIHWKLIFDYFYMVFYWTIKIA